MRNSFTYILFLLLLVLVGCRLEVPEDVFEHEEINKAQLSVTNSTTGAIQTVTILNNGMADRELVLENGASYNVNLRFYGNHGGEIEDMTPEVIEEKDEHFLTYAFSGVAVFVTRSVGDPVRTDGKKLGLNTEWKVQSVPQPGAFAEIKLNHSASEVKDTGAGGDQKGETTGGETDVLLKVSVK